MKRRKQRTVACRGSAPPLASLAVAVARANERAGDLVSHRPAVATAVYRELRRRPDQNGASFSCPRRHSGGDGNSPFQRHRRPSWTASRVVLGVAAIAAAAVVIVVALGAFGSSSGAGRFRAALGPTPSAPGASGQAILVKTSSGWRIALDARGLPRLDGGRF